MFIFKEKNVFLPEYVSHIVYSRGNTPTLLFCQALCNHFYPTYRSEMPFNLYELDQNSDPDVLKQPCKYVLNIFGPIIII